MPEQQKAARMFGYTPEKWDLERSASHCFPYYQQKQNQHIHQPSVHRAKTIINYGWHKWFASYQIDFNKLSTTNKSPGTVTFATKHRDEVTLSHDEFLERFLLHILPPRFVKIRHYGLMAASNATTKLEVARGLLEAQGARRLAPAPADGDFRDFYERLTGKDLRACPRCKGVMVRYELRSAHAVTVLARAGKGPDP